MPYCSRLILCWCGEKTDQQQILTPAKRHEGNGTREPQTHIVFLLGSNRIDEVVLIHKQLAILILLRMAQEIGASLVRQLRLLGAADQFLLDGLLDTGHCGHRGKRMKLSTTEDLQERNPPHAHTDTEGGKVMNSGDETGGG